MNDYSSDTILQTAANRMKSSDYAAHIQEAMRHGELRSWEYPVAMTIMRSLSQGHSEDMWKEEQQRTIQTLTGRSPEKNTPHIDASNQYEQLLACFKDLSLWPWS